MSVQPYSGHKPLCWSLLVTATVFVGCGSIATKIAQPSPPNQTGYPSASTQVWLTELASTGAPALAKNQSSPPTDVLTGMSGDPSGGVVISGFTLGTYPGFSNPTGQAQAIAVKYDNVGNKQWLLQFGTGKGDFLTAVGVDASNNSYVAGASDGTYPGQISSTGSQALIAKLDKSGNRLWTQEFNLGLGNTSINAVTVGSSGIPYVTGSFTPDGTTGTVYSFVAQIDPISGLRRWTQQYGVVNVITSLNGIASGSAGDIYIVGSNLTSTSNGTQSADVQRLSTSSGKLLWSRDLQAGSSSEYLLASVISSGDGNPVIAGSLSKSNSVIVGFGADPSASGVMSKLDANSGVSIWTVTPFSGMGDEITSVATAGNNFYAVGSTNGALSVAYTAQTEGDFLLKVDDTGHVVWVQQFGTGKVVDIQTPYGLRTATDGTRVYVGGPTQTPFPGFGASGLLQIFVSAWQF